MTPEEEQRQERERHPEEDLQLNAKDAKSERRSNSIEFLCGLAPSALRFGLYSLLPERPLRRSDPRKAE